MFKYKTLLDDFSKINKLMPVMAPCKQMPLNTNYNA